MVTAVTYVIARMNDSNDNKKAHYNDGWFIVFIIFDALAVILTGNPMKNSHFIGSHFDFVLLISYPLC